MCFSAPASFGASAALVPAGIYCARTAVRKHLAGLLPLAVVPLVLSVQQFCEGLVWVGVGQQDATLVRNASVAYLFIAIAFWPFWTPLSLLFTERRKWAKILLTILTVLGLAWTWLYLPIALEPDRWLTTEVVHHSIRYDYREVPGFGLAPRIMWVLGYLLVVCTALAVGLSRLGLKPRVGALSLVAWLALAASFLVSYLFFWYAFTSVWCFFAALLALFLCYVFSRLPDANPRQQATWGQGVMAGRQV